MTAEEVRFRDEAGETPIFWAARLLFNKGAKIDTVSSEGTTALHRAVQTNNGELIDWLASKGADINGITYEVKPGSISESENRFIF